MDKKAWREKRVGIADPGSYDVSVLLVDYDKSKAGNPMVIVVFKTDDGKHARSFFTKNEYGLKALLELKTAAGVDGAAASSLLLGKSLTIVCQLGEETKNKDGQRIRYIEVKRFLPFGASEEPATESAQDIEDKCDW